MSARFLASSKLLPSNSPSETLTLKSPPMGSQAPPPKRPFCPRCSKPLRVCLCSRLRSAPLANPVPITILQHSLERDHPLNSARVARLGLRNLDVVPVTDVNFRAHFTVVPVPPAAPAAVDEESLDLSAARAEKGMGSAGRMSSETGSVPEKTQTGKSLDFSAKILDFSVTHFAGDSDAGFGNAKGADYAEEVNFGVGFLPEKMETTESLDISDARLGISDDLAKRSGFDDSDREFGSGKKMKSLEVEKLDSDGTNKFLATNSAIYNGFKSGKRYGECGHTQDGGIATFDKYQVACSSTDLQLTVERAANPEISWVLDTPIGRAAASKGFTVRRLQREQLKGSKEFHDFLEFEITMPAGAALLFPSGKSAINVDVVDFEVKHLVVLDGTWKKARRIYCENPWLQLLPHLKLEPGKESLYSEVRHQPKAGCLSTIESIVCALKGLGKDMEGLDELLDVFEGMVEDQRRCKAENLEAKMS
ncbi:Uncharacterized protein M6B38_245915 [Iris pallida]|uniref:tRNA-uridine aminocarboxypropyltransferase n=1 Tax=Iris pallida TaxID=29817 RepID=A0AAX6DHC6_IRIPA|nr:Uncharacterized protein M6B38_245915 [Iris pallida]